jgi:2-oxoglutarate dehydrogenase E2 component (dihydrolipoamide succinyltransferase)
VPDLGKVEGDIVLISWLVNDGDHVTEGNEIVELETSKVTFSVESDKTGKIKLLKEKGSCITVGEEIAIIS